VIFLQKITEPTAFSVKRRQAAKKKVLKAVGYDKRSFAPFICQGLCCRNRGRNL
jgi:hypothetical protein